MQVYLLTFVTSIIISSLIAASNNKHVTRLFSILLALSISLPYYLRDYSIGTDTLSYVQYFEIIRNTTSLSEMVYLSSVFKVELGFFISTKILTILFEDNHLIFFTYAVSSYLLLINFFIKNKLNPILSTTSLFCLFPIFYYNFNIIRQAFAIMIVVYFINYLIKNEPLKFVVGIILAATFHKAALVCLVFLVIFKLKSFLYKNLIILPVFIFLSLIALYSIIPKYLTKYQVYISNNTMNNEEPFSIYSLTLVFAILVFSHLMQKSLPTYYKEHSKFIIIILTVFLIYNSFLYYIGFSNQGLNRMSFYFMWPLIYIIPISLRSFKDTKQYYLASSIALIFYVILSVYVLYSQPDAILPFKFKS